MDEISSSPPPSLPPSMPSEAPEAPASPAAPAPRSSESPLGSPFADEPSGLASLGMPLIVDRGEMRLGTTVQYRRIPRAERKEATDLMALTERETAPSPWSAYVQTGVRYQTNANNGSLELGLNELLPIVSVNFPFGSAASHSTPPPASGAEVSSALGRSLVKVPSAESLA